MDGGNIFGVDDQMSIGDKSCGRNKLTSGEKLSADRFKIDDVVAVVLEALPMPPALSQKLCPFAMAGDCICGGVNQTVLLESFFIISVACDNFEFGVSHKLAGVDVDFLN